MNATLDSRGRPEFTTVADWRALGACDEAAHLCQEINDVLARAHADAFASYCRRLANVRAGTSIWWRAP